MSLSVPKKLSIATFSNVVLCVLDSGLVRLSGGTRPACRRSFRARYTLLQTLANPSRPAMPEVFFSFWTV